MPQVTTDNQESQVRVLLVDDQKEVLRVLQLILMRHPNYRVETALSGQQALEKAEVFSPDIVISDISMPGMDGCQMMTQLRAKQNVNPFKSIALSGYGGSQEDVTLAAGYDVHIEKPVDYEDLTDVIDRLVQEKVDAS